jgi:sarcosine oxidase subunit beta
LFELPLSLRSRAIWENLVEVVGTDCEYRRSGHLRLAKTAAAFEAVAAYAELVRPAGLDLEVIDGTEIRRRHPAFTSDLAGATWSAGDGQANPRLAAPAFARAARAAGAEIRDNTRVVAIEPGPWGFTVATADGLRLTVPQVINSAGAWAPDLAASLGDAVPGHPIYPNMVVTEPLPPLLTCSLGTYGNGVYLRQVERGNVVFGMGRGRLAAPDRAVPLADTSMTAMAEAAWLLPALAHAHVIRTWTGIEGELADGQPVIGPSPRHAGLFHAFGLSGHGFQLAPAIGAVLAELATTGSTPTPIDGFALTRFAAA